MGVPWAPFSEGRATRSITILALRVAFTKDGMRAVTGIRRRQRQGKVLTTELEQQILGTT